MINALIDWSLRNRLLILCATLFVIGWGIRAVRQTPVDAIPDLSENQVLVYADWSGRSPQEVEDQLAYPLSVNLQGLAGVKAVRANAMFGFALVTVVFEENVPRALARQRVSERMSFLASQLPAGVAPQLGADATGLGWVYQYYLDVETNAAPRGGYDLGQLRSLQDFFIRQQLVAVSGVAEVASIGGFVRQYQLELDPRSLRSAGVSLRQVLDAIAANHLNVGGKVVEENGMEFVVRGLGLIRRLSDLESIAVTQSNGVPVLLRDLGRAQIGGEFRRGTLDVDGREVVGGIVVMRTGENAMAVIERVKSKLAQIAPSLPPGIAVRAFYDRSELITRTIETLRHALIDEMIFVTIAHIFFLFHFRSILIVTIPLPISILIAFLLMEQFDISSNIMSLTGIAIAVGVLVDAGIVMTENVIRHAERAAAAQSPASMLDITRAAARQVGRPIFFAMAIIILAFVPVFALRGQEGKLFHPLAFTKTFAMVGSTLLAITLVPVLCSLLVRGPFRPEERNWLMRGLLALYNPVLDWALCRRRTVLALAALVLTAAIVLAAGLPRSWRAALESLGAPRLANATRGFGRDFMPPLKEGSLLFMPVLLPSTSLTEVKRIMAWQDRVIRLTPEVASVAGKLGRAETPTDPAPVEMIETTITLKPEWIADGWRVRRNPDWRSGMTQEQLVTELTEKLTQIPGYVPGFLQPIENRILMLSTGIRAQLGIKILGDNLDTLQSLAYQAQRMVEQVRGAVGVAASRVQGKPYLEIEVDRERAGRWGVAAQDIFDTVEVGIGGRNVGMTIEGRERYPIQVRFGRSDREDPDRLAELLVTTSAGRFIPLGQLATIRRTLGPSEIASEDGRLRAFVQANVQGRDLAGFVEEVKARLQRDLVPRLPPGVTLEYAGEYENLLRASQTLHLIVPAVLVIIFLLLFVVYGSVKEAAHVILAVPFALSGGVFLQWLLGYNSSVAVWVGYIALFGTAIQTGVVMVVYLDETLEKKRAERGLEFNHADLLEAVRDGARLRLRPKVMTVATIVASLLPIMWSQRVGAEVMKPLATPVIGGMLSSLVHILIVTPVLFTHLRERELFPRLRTAARTK